LRLARGDGGSEPVAEVGARRRAGRRTVAGARPRVREAVYLTAFLRPDPAVKRGTRLAAMVIVSPVRGLRPSRAPRLATWNLPKPVKLTSSPALSESSIELMTASTALPASFLLRPLFAATLSTNSAFVVMTYSSFCPRQFPGDLDDGGDGNSAIGRSRAKFGAFPAISGNLPVAFWPLTGLRMALGRRNQPLGGLQQRGRGRVVGLQ